MKVVTRLTSAFMIMVAASACALHAEGPTGSEIMDAMRRAADFMDGSVSNHGGYLWAYSYDLATEFHGEAPARPSQIWVQGATTEMGETFLRAWRVTGDDAYLRYAKNTANALIYGQHPLGGWHYFIDFDMPGLADWYEHVASRFKWGMEEYRHWYGNCTYDDNTTQGATLLLLRVYMATLDAAYRPPIDRALDFILMSQFPNGAWPQRYPLRHEFVHDGLADYTSYYTLNDNSMRDILNVLVEAWEKLGDERYLDAALRGADFIILAQLPEPQAGWAEQYTHDMQPAWARTHEPKGVMTRQSIECIKQLEDFYLMTGDRRYLAPIPAALDWLYASTFGQDDSGRYRMARYYEVGTNEPIFQHKTDRVNEEGYGLYHYDHDGRTADGGWNYLVFDLDAVKREYERVAALSPDEARAKYKRSRRPSPPARRKLTPALAAAADSLVGALDDRGAWVSDRVSVYDTTQTMISERPRKFIRGIDTGMFRRNMETLMHCLQAVQ